jgi:hypothetical protein
MKIFTVLAFLLLIAPISSYGMLGERMGFLATLSGSLDFINFEKPELTDTSHKATGFGIEISPGIRYSTWFVISPFAMFTSATDSDNENLTYFMTGYGGELKLRIAPINIKGGYGLYMLDEKLDKATVSFKNGAGWHAGVGFEALLGPGLTIFLDAKYRFINFVKYAAEMSSTSAILGVTSYF